MQVLSAELFLRDLRTRLPFRYGIATMTRVPHLVLRLTVEIEGREQRGFAADHLPPKWFTKDPATTYRDDLTEMLAVIEHACKIAQALPPQPSVAALWREMSAAQKAWAGQEYPPLLAGFGVSLVERAVIDAFCRATRQSFAQAVRMNAFALNLGELYPELAGTVPADFLPPAPLRSILVRHTIGLTDPLAEEDVEDAERVRDGLPQSLEAFIAAHGLTHFKIKLCGDIERDRTRLHGIAELLAERSPRAVFTLDGNENFRSVAPFRALWEEFHGDPIVRQLFDGLLFVEQPFHRDIALNAATAAELLAWRQRPPMIIDESDGELGALTVALAGGYAGASHKNCKGVFKGLANACLIAHRRRTDPARALHLSAEDLTNTGPVALNQDLAAVATLGITHAERNGHHYFAGLSQFPPEIHEAILAAHPDLYERHNGYPACAVRAGRMEIGSIVDAPFGVGFEPDLASFTPLAQWSAEGL